MGTYWYGVGGLSDSDWSRVNHVPGSHSWTENQKFFSRLFRGLPVYIKYHQTGWRYGEVAEHVQEHLLARGATRLRNWQVRQVVQCHETYKQKIIRYTEEFYQFLLRNRRNPLNAAHASTYRNLFIRHFPLPKWPDRTIPNFF